MTTFEHSRTLLLSTLPDAERIITASASTDPAGPTPCTDFDVAALRAHLQAVLLRINAMGRGEPALSVSDSVTCDDPAAAWRAAAAETPALWAEVAADAPMTAPWRTLTAWEAAEIYGAEVAVHTWDLAVATGQQFDIDDAAAEAFTRAYTREVPVEQRAAIFAEVAASIPPDFPWQDPFGPAVPTGADATNIERVVAISGRDPHWRP
ncbi:MAG: TIGR03086 family metal-binding protein [Nocardioides sp.]